MTSDVRQQIIDAICEGSGFIVPTSQVHVIARRIEKIIDTTTTEAILRSIAFGDMLDAVGLEIRPKED